MRRVETSLVRCVCALVAGIWCTAFLIVVLQLHGNDAVIGNNIAGLNALHFDRSLRVATVTPSQAALIQNGLPPLVGSLHKLDQVKDFHGSDGLEAFSTPESNGIIEIAFVRHGQAVSNLPTSDCFGAGAMRDPKLTSMGSMQALSAGELLRKMEFFPTHVYVSPLSRTLQTRHEVLRGLDRQIDTIALSFLQEMNLNDCDIGRPVAELLRDPALKVDRVDFSWLKLDWFRIKHQNTSTFRAGFKRQWMSLLSTMSPGKHLVVSHRGALEWLLQLPERGETSFDNGELRIFRLRPRWKESVVFPFIQQYPTLQASQSAVNAPPYWPSTADRVVKKTFKSKTPSRSKRVVWFVRHGQAMHNIVDCHDCIGSSDSTVVVDRSGRNKENVFVTCANCKDPDLTSIGRQQIQDAHKRLRSFIESQEGRALSTLEVALYFERIFFSPLSRTADTMGILLFGNTWNSDNIFGDMCSEENVGECRMLGERIIAEALVQETNAGVPDASWDTGVDPRLLQGKFKQFPHCCKNLDDDWMRPSMNVQQRIKEFNERYLDTPNGLSDLLVVSHSGAISTFLPGKYLDNGQIQRCEYDVEARLYWNCQSI